MVLVSGSTKTVGRLASSWPGRLGVLLSPSCRNSISSVLATNLLWGADNGAFSGFDPVAFRRMLRRIAGKPRLLWVTCPDVVADARATVALFREWEPELREARMPVAFVLQDGQEDMELPPADCYFVGGSTKFKLSESAGDLAAEGNRRGAWLHMGRVNSRRRLETALSMGCDSIDGSSMSMFGDTHILKFLLWTRWLEARKAEQPTLY